MYLKLGYKGDERRNLFSMELTDVLQIGFPVLTVIETPEGIRVRQDRFLETRKGQGAENETIWLVYSCLSM